MTIHRWRAENNTGLDICPLVIFMVVNIYY